MTPDHTTHPETDIPTEFNPSAEFSIAEGPRDVVHKAVCRIARQGTISRSGAVLDSTRLAGSPSHWWTLKTV